MAKKDTSTSKTPKVQNRKNESQKKGYSIPKPSAHLNINVSPPKKK